MSERSIYLRDQADKCRQHANIVGDARTREELRKLAAVYIALAEQIESKGRLEPPNACACHTPTSESYRQDFTKAGRAVQHRNGRFCANAYRPDSSPTRSNSRSDRYLSKGQSATAHPSSNNHTQRISTASQPK